MPNGANSNAYVMFLFTKDRCGQNEKPPRHVKEYRNLRRLEQQIKDERLACLKEFNKEAKDGRFPSAEYSVNMLAEEFEKFIEQMESRTTGKS